MTPSEFMHDMRMRVKPQQKTAFLTAFIAGLLVHLPMLLSDIPNHDGLSSIYFDQNMITSGRWFLMIACGFSSFYNLPWLIGLLGMAMLSLTCVVLTDLLEFSDKWSAAMVSLIVVTFPVLASNLAYAFTFDGYMMGVFLAVLAVRLVERHRYGFAAGGISLAFSMGIYQAYLPFAMVLSLYMAVKLCCSERRYAEKARGILRYAAMGILGVGLYYIILRVLLVLEHKQLDTYQGIDGLGSFSVRNFPSAVIGLYRDFLAFSKGGRVLFNNALSLAAVLVLVVSALFCMGEMAIQKKWWKKPSFFIIIVMGLFLLPLFANVILMVSPDVTYHTLMRYQWVLIPVLLYAVAAKYGKSRLVQWGATAAVLVLVLCYAVTDNIAYSNLQKKYEKTYAYCLRLLDRIEQTPGYYRGIPIALVGVVGDEQFPETDITGEITGNLIGADGDYLLYSAANYEQFMKYYMGVTLNPVPIEKMAEIYYTEEYMEMESFPGATSVKIIDGVLCVKTENVGRE